MSSTISTTLTHGITLTSPTYLDPVTITGAIDPNIGNAIIVNSFWSIVNTGSIITSTGEGIFLKAGGVIDNLGTILGGGSYGISVNNFPISIQNSGYIHGGRAGIFITHTGLAEDVISIVNEVGGTIAGDGNPGTILTEAIKLSGAQTSLSSLINYGLIINNNTSATGGAGVRLNQAVLTNEAGAIIAGGSVGVDVGGASEVINMGTIFGETGISIGSNQNNVTIVDGGTIVANAKSESISFASGSVGDSLTLLPGAQLDGLAYGGIDATVDFAGTSPGTLDTFGDFVTAFPTIHVDSGAEWNFSGTSTMSGQSILINDGMIIETTGDNLTVSSSVGGTGSIDLAGGTISFNGNIGSNGSIVSDQTVDFTDPSSVMVMSQSHSLTGQIEGFVQGNTIELTGYGASETVTGIQSGDLFEVVANGSTMTLTFAAGTPPLDLMSLATISGSKSYEIIAPCFRIGTRILTPEGPRAIESLSVGDLVVAHSGGFRPIAWQGHRHVDCIKHPNPSLVWPILISEGAFGPGVPSRDLYVSPDHAIYCDRVLVPAKCLIDGVSIRQVEVADVTYHHIELETHDAVWAETLPAETYLDCGNRRNFAGQHDAIALHADFSSPRWDADRAFAPLVFEGPLLAAIRQRLHDRLREKGIRAVAGRFAVYVDGRLLESACLDGDQKTFRLPPGSHRLFFDSSYSSPGDFDPESLDRRRLGIAITNLMTDGAFVEPTDLRFGAGFHPAERRGRRWHRWTDGAGSFDVRGIRDIAFTVQAVSPVWHVPDDWRRPAMRRRVLESH